MTVVISERRILRAFLYVVLAMSGLGFVQGLSTDDRAWRRECALPFVVALSGLAMSSALRVKIDGHAAANQ